MPLNGPHFRAVDSSAQPEISVIMPVWNGAAYLKRSIDSVLAQSFSRWELLAVDDGSTDGSYDILHTFASTEPRIRVFRSSRNEGASAARNRALRAARGKAITYLDCDDEYYADYLHEVSTRLGQWDVLVFAYDILSPTPERDGKPHPATWDPARVRHHLMDEFLAIPLGVAHQRRLLDQVGLFNENLHTDEDSDLWRRFASFGALFFFVPLRSGQYHVRADSQARTRRVPDAANANATEKSPMPLTVQYVSWLTAVESVSDSRSAGWPAPLQRLLVMGSDSNYYKYTLIALRSFLRHNPDWRVLVMDVGMTQSQVGQLERLGKVVTYAREEHRGAGLYVPSAKARCLALAEFPADDTLMLYLDSDTVTLGSIEPLIRRFICSRKPIGIAREDDTRFIVQPVATCWEGSRIPAEFGNAENWHKEPFLNTGVLLATGTVAAEVGKRCIQLYEKLKTRFMFGEQTIIDSVLYDSVVELFHLPTKYHCFLFEEFLRHVGRPYIDPAYVDQEEVIIRHFCYKNKAVLDPLVPTLLEYYRLPLTPTRLGP
jgi:lipopolysaccharide biosynthesis glycosyltransferase